MPEVTCPACHTRRAIDADASGYTCDECGAEWDFVTCSSCGSRFHAAPDAPAWRCPTCGAENARPHAGRTTAFAGSELPLGPNRMMILGAVGVILIALVTWALTRDGDDTAGGTAPTATAPAPTDVASVNQALCSHLVDIQSLRFDALGEVASTLRDDAAAIDAAGDPDLARDVTRLARRVAALQRAYDTPETEDDDAATQAVLDALAPIPC
ncbi:MAG TPA: hypothetical protein VLA82_14950 [Actinomycetota bacterium]|nr:hypothetical protein [Actinomycetota bacterium]